MRLQHGLVVLVLIAATVFGLAILLPTDVYPPHNGMHGFLGACEGNVRQIGLAIQMYADDHNGILPRKIEDIPKYLGSDHALFCPSMKDKTHYSYALTSATNVWGVSTNTIILREIEASHQGKRVVLFDDGRVGLEGNSQL